MTVGGVICVVPAVPDGIGPSLLSPAGCVNLWNSWDSTPNVVIVVHGQDTGGTSFAMGHFAVPPTL